jgi:PKD repeat protein
MIRVIRALLTGLCLAVCFLLVGCGSTSKPSIPIQDSQENIPFPDARVSAGLTETVIAGKDAEQRSPFTSPSGDALYINEGPDSQYALYRFNPGDNPLDSLKVLFRAQQTQGAFIGLPDYDLQRWQFSGPYDADKTLLLDQPGLQSASGDLWIAIVVPPGATAVVDGVSVRYEGEPVQPRNIAPVAEFAMDKTTGKATLQVDFDASASTDIDGTIQYYYWDWNDDGVYDDYRLTSTISHSFSQPGAREVTLKIYDNDMAFATVSQTVMILPANVAPQPALDFTPDSGASPLTVNFDASNSIDSDGSIVTYEWDFEDDGSFEQSGPSTSHTYSAPGVHNLVLRVTDDDGGRSTITTNWGIKVGPCLADVWFLPGSAERSSVALIGGKPAIAYTLHFFLETGPLYYRQALTADATNWPNPVELIPLMMGESQQLAEVGGSPAVSFMADTNGYEVRYVRSLNSSGTTWGSAVTVGYAETWWITTNSLAEVNGKPGIVPRPTTGTLRLWHAADVTGTIWPAATVVAPIGEGATLLEVDSVPAIVYLDDGIHYIQATDVAGTSWQAPVILETDTNASYPSIAIVGGYPAIAYNRSTGIYFVRADDPDGASWPVPQLIDPLARSNVSLAVVGGRPIIVGTRSSGTLNKIGLSWSPDATGTSWSPLTNVGIGKKPRIVDANGTPGVAYGEGGIHFALLQ